MGSRIFYRDMLAQCPGCHERYLRTSPAVECVFCDDKRKLEPITVEEEGAFLVSFTYDIVTPESAEHGDTAENGFETSFGVFTLAQLLYKARDLGLEGAEDSGSWFTGHPSEDHLSGESTTHSMHVEFFRGKPLTGDHYGRIKQLIGAR